MLERKPSLLSPPSSRPLLPVWLQCSSGFVCTPKLTSKEKTEPGNSPLESGPGTPETQQRSQHLPTFAHIEPFSGKKRIRSADSHASEQSQEPSRKRNKKDFELGSQQDLNGRTEVAQEQDPIQCWALTGQWPKEFGKMSNPESDGSKKRRLSTTPSYSSRVRDGIAPPAHTPAYEEELERYGIMFDDLNTRDLVTAESKTMCEALLRVKEEELGPAYNSCSEETYIRVFQVATKRNEEMVRRDLTPHVLPSAGLLCSINREMTLENVREELGADWTECNLIGGTQPRPDFAYGMSLATFTEEERAKMQNYSNINNPTKFTESMYFPFLLCEVKCGRKNINDSDRQNAHSASIAVNAVVQLCRAAGGEDSTQSLSGQILVFSISHDNERVKIYGHFPLIRDGRTTFHRYSVRKYNLDDQFGRDGHIGSNFTRALYRDFYPLHLRRIQGALARLPDPRTTSAVTGDSSIGEDEMQGIEQPSAEIDSSSKSPVVRAQSRTQSRGSQMEWTLMKQQFAKTEEMYKAQLEQLQKQKEESQQQMEQLREDSQKQLEQLREESQKQMEQLREDNRKQMEQQREHSQKQIEQQREDSQKQISLLERLLDQTR